MSSPKISVCIPVRNGGEFLPLAVDSVLAQSFADVELIIVDNCSTDGTAAWVERKLPTAPAIRFFKNTADIGMVGNFNACLSHAEGDYIKFLCADDLLLPHCLHTMAKALDADPAVMLVAGGRRLIDEAGRKIATQKYAAEPRRVSGAEVINRCLFGKNYIGEPSAVMFRRTAAARGFQASLSHLMDLEMWFHLLEQGAMVNLTEELCAIRRHSGQMSEKNIRSGALIDDNLRLFAAYGAKPYIRHTWKNSTNRKLRMAYRVWLCRNSLSADKADKILDAHSSRLFYYLMMPVFAPLLTTWRGLRLLYRRKTP
jgi:glycosyltransferase involved in cell wall biosynthesis